MNLGHYLLKANNDIAPKEERSSIKDQVIGNQDHFLDSYFHYYCGYDVSTLEPVVV
jgi:hypothetical protein